ncbi:(2Fe-2S)-binding protein [Actinophytocola oryzae]|uniref:(2Fe-2S)-binding protein n=1 Tax=Actinophytocola oryzae TaxID=502181 RepID=UPI001FBACEA5|nr:(2Fe-2S)-binding protein [Actinophytocola oryzae]
MTAAYVADLSDSVARAGSCQAKTQIRVGLPDDSTAWVNCAELLSAPETFTLWRQELAGWLHDRYGEAPERTTAGYVMSWYLSVPAYLAALLFHHERRVPSLRPEHLAFRKSRPRPHPDSIAVLDEGFVCLPDDPAAGTPNATVVTDERALAAVLRGRFTAHAAQFVSAFGKTVRFGRRTLWGAATDALDNWMWLAGRYGGDEVAGVLDAALLLDDRFEPLTSASTLRPVTDAAGHTRWTRRRESCCFHYLMKAGQGVCETCPRVCPKY